LVLVAAVQTELLEFLAVMAGMADIQLVPVVCPAVPVLLLDNPQLAHTIQHLEALGVVQEPLPTVAVVAVVIPPTVAALMAGMAVQQPVVQVRQRLLDMAVAAVAAAVQEHQALTLVVTVELALVVIFSLKNLEH
jgi:hypothetical protein